MGLQERRSDWIHRILTVLLLCLTSPMMVSASTTLPVQAIDVNESGRVLAQLDDVRAIFFVLIVVIVLMMALVVWERRGASSAFAKSIDRLANAVDTMTRVETERTTAELVHNARMESVIGRVEAHLTRAEFRDGRA